MFYALLMFAVVATSCVQYTHTADDDFLQKQLRERAKWSQVISRLSEIIEVAEEATVYTEDPPQLVITISGNSTVTVTGPIARRAYEAAQSKKEFEKNVQSPAEILEFMRQFINMDGQKASTERKKS